MRTDPAPGFQALYNDTLLKKHRITVEIGRVKNRIKNPVAERAIQELEEEIPKPHAWTYYTSIIGPCHCFT